VQVGISRWERDQIAELKAAGRSVRAIDYVPPGSHIPDVELTDHYRMADIFVMPSTGEGFGIVFLEAIACGLPAVGLDMDGSVDPLETAALGHPVNEAQLESTIENILNAPPPRARPDHPFATGRFSRHLGTLLGGVV